MAERGQEGADHAIMRDALGLQAGEPWCQMAVLCNSENMRPCVALARHGGLSGVGMAAANLNAYAAFQWSSFARYWWQDLEGKSGAGDFETGFDNVVRVGLHREAFRISVASWHERGRDWRASPRDRDKY